MLIIKYILLTDHSYITLLSPFIFSLIILKERLFSIFIITLLIQITKLETAPFQTEIKLLSVVYSLHIPKWKNGLVCMVRRHAKYSDNTCPEFRHPYSIDNGIC